MALAMISVEDGYVVFEDENGDEITATPLPVMHELTMWADFDLSGAWLAAKIAHRDTLSAGVFSWQPDRETFVAQIRREIADQDSVNVVWCENCEDPTDGEDATVVNGDAYACPTCFEDYRSCDDCGNCVHYDNTSYTLSDETICQRCCDNNYSYCEDCDGYFYTSGDDSHNHGGCDCEPPTLDVTMPNGDAVLTEDDRIAVSLPAGIISEEGINSIIRLIRNHGRSFINSEGSGDYRKWWDVSFEVSRMDARWQTKEGNFTKRLSKLAHKTHGLKVPAELLTKIGNVARDNSAGSDIYVELTRNLNLSAEDFYHGDSCWWQSYAESRCALKSNGGIGMRTFSESGEYGNGSVTGRAWVMPLRLDEHGALVATFDALTADAYVVFNGYGDLQGYTPARVVAGMVGMTYRKVVFDCDPMYVNGNSGYLVAPEGIAAKYTNGGHLSLDVDTHSSLYHNEASARIRADHEATRALATV